MKRFIAGMILISAAAMSFAQGGQEVPFGPAQWESQEIEELSGTVEKGDYGHLELVEGNKHYLLGREDFYSEETLEELIGAQVELDGFEGPVMYTRDKDEFLSFFPMKAVINGEEMDLSELGIMPGRGRSMGAAAGRGRPGADGGRGFSGMGRNNQGKFGNSRGMGPGAGACYWDVAEETEE